MVVIPASSSYRYSDAFIRTGENHTAIAGYVTRQTVSEGQHVAAGEPFTISAASITTGRAQVHWQP